VALTDSDRPEGELMLLNRQRVKFWQKIIFGFMAVLMGGFLIFGYSGVASSCGTKTSGTSGSGIDSQIKAALATLAKTPNDPTALLSAAQAYKTRGSVQTGVPDQAQSNDLTQSIAYYARYIALPDSALGGAAAGLRIDAYKNQAEIYGELVDYKSALAVYNKLLKLQPSDPTPYLGIASTDVLSNDIAGAIAAFTKYVKLDPHSQYAAQVKRELIQLKAAASASPSPSATP
jgi:tetratricopeptide (TPR) repeat protein